MRSLFLCVLLAFAAPAFAQHFTDSTCTKYFEMTDRLRQGDTLSRETWHNFVQDKAIKVYMADQGLGDAYLETYRKTLQFVYKPGNEAKLQARVKDSLNNWLVYLVYQYKKNEPGMRAYLKRIEKDPKAYFDVCYRYAYTALPKTPGKNCPRKHFRSYHFITMHTPMVTG